MTPHQLDTLTWQKSSRSVGQGDCVEVALGAAALLVRDSKNPSGSVLALPATGWRGLLNIIRSA
jgi:hypothetical protein